MKNYCITRTCYLTAVILATFAAGAVAQELNLGDYLVVDNGRLMIFKNGVSKAAEDEVTLTSGSKVTTNGLFILRAGVEKTLQPKQKLTMDGFLVGADGTLISPEDHVTVRNGKAQVVKDGVGRNLDQPITLANGFKVMPDGMVQQPDGKKVRLLDGMLLALSGNPLPAADHIMVRDGKVILQKDGGLITLAPGRTIMMSDGSKVAGDGTITRKDGSKVTLKDGYRMKLEGPAVSRAR